MYDDLNLDMKTRLKLNIVFLADMFQVVYEFIIFSPISNLICVDEGRGCGK